MVCVYCGADTAVKNSRYKARQNSIWRRRTCYGCAAVFTTKESAVLTNSWVVTENNSTEPFIQEKLFLSIYESLKHRDDAVIEAIGLTDTVVARIRALVVDGNLTKRQIKDTAVVCLARFDRLASEHYRAFHRN